ncbi:MAG: DNA-binding transcriptional regulator [Herbinix sp.]|jgi:predicted DNA-binding transcriptional regulator YafY|nr:DNA-binding transcriptional regulator [Herbinix sp.]
MKIDRLIGILTVLLQNNKVTAPMLAERFEVSRRTIMRDIDTLNQAGIPIVTTQGGDGGIAIMEGYKINKSVLTTDEMQNLVAAIKGLDSVSKTSNFENLMMKLAPENKAMISLADSVIIDLSSHYKDSLSEKIALIKQAISEHKIIGFDYYYQKGETQRKIEPYFIEFRWNSWYVFGWCCGRQDFRRFKLNRLWELILLNENYKARPIPADKANAVDSFPDELSLHILFDKSVRFRLIEDYGLNCYEETEKGLFLNLNYTNKEYVFSWLLGFGDKAEIIAPQDMRDEFAELAKNIARKY